MAEDNNQYEIALWGPTSSGKTWFIRAFARKLTQQLYKNDPNFKYEIKDYATGFAIDTTAPTTINGTDISEDSTWVFQRIPKQGTEAHKISKYKHVINVRDAKGKATINLQEGIYKSAKISIINSNYLLVMLDPTRIIPDTVKKIETKDDTQNSSVDPHNQFPKEPIEDDGMLTISEYVQKIRMLFQTLESNNSRYHIAVCITKLDTLGIRQRDPWEVIQMYFGDDMYSFLDNYRNYPGDKNHSASKKISLETFSTSSFGFLKGIEKIEQNHSEGVLKDSENWDPYNVEAPFFWLFDILEREKLKNQQSGWLGKLVFNQHREDLYIPYKIAKR